MPSTYAHYRFGKDVLAALPAKYREAASYDRVLFDIGLHGPDILFYYKPFSSDPLHAEASRLHHLSGTELFGQFGKTFLERGPRKSAFSYLCGFLCHFALDRACHGYVIALSDKGTVTHDEIESEFDRILLEEDGIDPLRTNSAAHIRPSKRTAAAMAPYFPGVSEEAVLKGTRSLVSMNRLLSLPGRFRTKLVYKLIRPLPGYPLIDGHLIKPDPDPRCAQSNIELRRMYEEAIPDACRFIQGFLPAIRGQAEWPEGMQDTFEGIALQDDGSEHI